MIQERKEGIMRMTEAQALERMAGFGFKVEVVRSGPAIIATASVIRPCPNSKMNRKEYFASVASFPFNGDMLEYAEQSSLMRRLLVRVLDRMEEKRNRGPS